MTDAQKRKTGGWLLLVAVVCVVAGVVMWQRASEDADNENDVARITGFAVGRPVERVEPELTPSYVLFGVAAFSGLGGLILLAGAKTENATTPPSGDEGEGTV